MEEVAQIDVRKASIGDLEQPGGGRKKEREGGGWRTNMSDFSLNKRSWS